MHLKTYLSIVLVGLLAIAGCDDWTNYALVSDSGGTPGIATFNWDRPGNELPAFRLSGGETGFGDVRGIALDVYCCYGGELYSAVFDANSVVVHDLWSRNDTAPRRVITGSNTQLSNPNCVAIDRSNTGSATDQELFVSNHGNSIITAYQAKEEGDVTPIRTISDGTDLDDIGCLSFDASREELFVSVHGNDSIRIYDSNADGSSSELRLISGANTMLNNPTGMAVWDNELYVANTGGNSVLVFSRTANGNVAPLRVIAGDLTQLSEPTAIKIWWPALSSNDKRLMVIANKGSNKILGFDFETEGNSPPIHEISGSNTGLSNIFGLAVWTQVH